MNRRTFLHAASLAFMSSLTRRAWSDGGAAPLGSGTAPLGAGATPIEGSLLRFSDGPQNLATPLAYFDRAITPTPVFFVRSHFGPPALDPARTFTVGGLVKTKLTLGAADLRGLPEVTLTAVLQCAGNGRAFIEPRVPGIQWTHGAMGQATFTGVRLADLLAKAGVDPQGTFVRVSGADTSPKPTVPSFVRSIPIARALDPSTLVAYRMNGEPLTLAHGAPLRLVVPGWAGDHWVKWLTEIHVQKEEADGFYMQTAYKFPTEPVTPGAPVPPEKMRSLTTFPVKSVIARPADRERRAAGKQEVVGIAFSGEAPIARVEVSIDGGRSWNAATLEGEGGKGRWQVFRYTFEQKSPGSVTALARATDAKKNAQPELAVWNPGGYFWNAWHRVTWEVA